jgi:hypothetical protein
MYFHMIVVFIAGKKNVILSHEMSAHTFEVGDDCIFLAEEWWWTLELVSEGGAGLNGWYLHKFYK